MNATREIITDLLPLYFSGEASADTRALVEEFFAQDPEFERMARRLAGSLNTLKAVPATDDEALEKRALVRTRSEIHGRHMSLSLAVVAIVAILIITISKDMHSFDEARPLLVLACVACVAIFGLLAKRTRKTGL